MLLLVSHYKMFKKSITTAYHYYLFENCNKHFFYQITNTLELFKNMFDMDIETSISSVIKNFDNKTEN
jgi:hypothetical protein